MRPTDSPAESHGGTPRPRWNEVLRAMREARGVTQAGWVTFEQTNGGTRVTFRGDSNPLGVLKLLSPVFNRRGEQVWSQRLGRIKTVLETSAP